MTRAVCLVDELVTLPKIEMAGWSSNAVGTQADLAASVRELINRLRHQSEAMAHLDDRLERLAAAR